MKTTGIFKVVALSVLASGSWNSAWGQGELKLPSDYFKSLMRFRLGAAAVEQLPQFPYETFDEKNGYCALGMDHGGMGFIFAMWNKEGGKVFGFSEPSSRDSNSYETSFWTYEGRWLELKDVAPPLSLEDFWDEHRAPPPELKPYAFFEMDLPRTGTTIKVHLKGICVDNDCVTGYRLGREATYNQIELVWQPKHGRFVKGSKSLRR